MPRNATIECPAKAKWNKDIPVKAYHLYKLFLISKTFHCIHFRKQFHTLLMQISLDCIEFPDPRQLLLKF